MGKVKKGTIFKIFLVTLLIILSTISTVHAWFSVPIFSDEEYSDSQADVSKSLTTPDSAYKGAKQELDIDNIDFNTLEGNNNVLCDEQGHELKYKSGSPKFGETIEFDSNSEEVYPEDVTSGYHYTNTGSHRPTPTEAYILAHIDNGGAISHWSRAAQWAWWGHGRANLGYSPENSSTGFGYLEDSENPVKNEVKNNEISTQIHELVCVKVDESTDFSKEEIEKICSVFNNNKNISAFQICSKMISKDETDFYVELTQEQQSKLLSIVLQASEDVSADVYGEAADNLGDSEIKGGAGLLQEATAFGQYAQQYLDGNGNLRDGNDPKLNYKDNAVYFDQKLNAWLVGPITAEYPYFIYNNIKFAGIIDVTLSGLYNKEIDGEKQTEINPLTYNPDSEISALAPSEYTFIKKDGTHFVNSEYYPKPNEDFYIAVKYDENLEQLTNFSFKNTYTTYNAENYDFYKSEYYYYKYDWKTEVTVEFTDPQAKVVTSNDKWSQLATNPNEPTIYQTYTNWNQNVNTNLDSKVTIPMDGYPTEENLEAFKNSIKNPKKEKYPLNSQFWRNSNGNWIFDRAWESLYTITKESETKITSWTCTGTPTPVNSDPQDLVVSGSVSVNSNKDAAEIEILWGKTIELTKNVVTEDGIEIDPKQEFNYKVVMDFVGNEKYQHLGEKTLVLNDKEYLIVNQGTIRAGQTISGIELPPIYLSDFDGNFPEYFIVETDQFGQQYKDWNSEENKNLESYWNKYTPENDGIETGDVVHLKNTKKAEHSHLKIDKRIKADAADGTPVYFRITYNCDGIETTDYIKLIPSTAEEKFEVYGTSGNLVGYVETGVENDEAFAKFTSLPIVWKGEVPATFNVVEVDDDNENALIYQEYQNLKIAVENQEKVISETDVDSFTDAEKQGYMRSLAELNDRKARLAASNWSKFESPVTENTSGSFKDYVCNCSGNDANEIIEFAKASTARIKNNLKSTEFEVTLEKRNQNQTSQYEAKFDVFVEGYYFGEISEENPTSSAYTQYIDTLKVFSDSGKTETTGEKIRNPIDNYKYFVTIKEKDSNYKWIDYIFDGNEEKDNVIEISENENIIEKAAGNPEKWIVKRNVEGTIIEATKLIENYKENKLSVVAINNGEERYTGLVISKDVIDVTENKDYSQYPDAFYFKLEKLEHGGYKAWDAVTELFNEENLVKTDNGIIIKVPMDENYYILVSNMIAYNNFNPKESIPNVKLIEVDQYGEEYSENPSNEDSIWHEYIPKKAEKSGALKVYTSEEAALKAQELAISGKYDDNDSLNLLTFHFDNYKKYDANLKVEKIIANGKEWQEDTKFYFQVAKVGIDNELEYITDKVFEEEYIAKEGYYGQNPAIVLTKEIQEIESKFISWDAKSANNKYAIFEVDQYGELYDPKKENIKSDSNWNDYAPSDNKGYKYFTFEPGNSVTYDVTFKNIAQEGTITINKVIENSEFLDYEIFYFQVEENGKDVTEKLFKEENLETIDNETYVVVKKENETTGVTSEKQLGNHTYTITEYDENHVTYKEYKDNQKSSDFWGAGFIPSNDGVWTVELNSSEGPSFVKAVNYRVVDLEIFKEITGDITEEDYNQEFDARIAIKPKEGTKRIFVKENDKIKVYEDPDNYFYKDITISANKSVVIEGISWEGEAPLAIITEQDLPENWILVGYEPSSSITLNSNSNLNKLKIINKKETEMTLQITKNIVDLQGKLTTLENDSPIYYFDVLAKDLEAGDTILVDGVETEVDGTSVDGGYTRLTKLEIVVPAGQSSETVTIQGINGNNLEYKVVEVDQHGEEYSENPTHEDSIWKTTKPTVFANGKLGSTTGIWTGTISNKDGAPLAAVIDAYNTIRKVDISMTKTVYEDGKPVDMEEKESFDYIAEFSNGVTEEFTIVYEENAKGKASTWHKEFILDLDETLTYIITEVDEKGDSFENRTEDSVFWSMFEPVDGKGIIEGTVESETVAEIRLSGQNKRIKNVYGQLEVIKTAEDAGNQFFYFVVEENNENVVKDLFEKYVELDKDDETKIPAIEVAAGSKGVKSKIQIWDVYEKAPEYKVIEVDQHGEEYSENPTHDDSIWHSWEPTFKEGNTVTLKGYEKVDDIEAVGTTVHHETNTQIKKQSFTIIKTINGGPIIDGENFYFEISKNGKQVTGEELSKLFPDATIVDDKIRLYKEEGKDAVDSATSIEVDIINDKYIVTEVDQHGSKCTDKDLKEDSLWHKYSVDNNGTWEVTEEQPEIKINNIINNATILIVKELLEGQSWPEGKEFSFNIYINGEQNPSQTVTLTETKQSEALSFEWSSNEGNQTVRVKEIGFEPIEMNVGGKPYNPDTDEIVLENEKNVTFTVVNDGGDDEPNKENGTIKITKKLIPGAQSDEEFTFEYKYSNEENSRTITLKAGETKETVPATWDEGTEAPTFTIKEIDKVPVNVTTTVKETEKVTNEDGKVIGISGKFKSGNNGVVDVTFENDGEWNHSGSLNVVKKFSTPEKMTIKDLLEELKSAYGENYKFKFILSIEPGDENSVFICDNTEYPNNKNSKYEKEVTCSIADFISACDDSTSDSIDFDIFGEITVQWPEGSKAPKYKVTESATEGFWTSTISENSASSFVDNEKVEVTINNTYIPTKRWDLTTRMAGIVWKDASIPNKQDANNVEGGADGRYLPDNEIDGIRDELITENVYVRIARVIYDEFGNIAQDENGNPMKTYNSKENQFIYDTTNAYYQVTDGHWNFNKVSVPAFTQKEIDNKITFENGYRIKYDVEFFYDGVTYQPTEKLVIEENGELISKTADDYKADSDNEQYFISSSAIDDLTDRKEFNEKYTTVKGDTVMQENGDSTGKLEGDEKGISADIKYEGNIENGAIVSKNISTGTLDLGVTSENYEQKLMKATTGNTGLTYFFEGEMLVTDEDGNMEYATGDGQYIRLTPGNCNGYYEDRSINTDADCVVIDKHYKKIYDYALNINLGLVEKQKVNLSLEKDICAVTVIVNENSHVYQLNTAKGQESITITEAQQKELDDFFSKLENENDINLFNVYTSDYNYRVEVYEDTPVKNAYDEFYSVLYHYNDTVEDLIKTKELQIYLTYGITATNRSAIYDAKIHSIVDYYDDSLTYVDVKTGYEADYIGGLSDLGSGLHAYVGDVEAKKAKLTNILADYDYYYNDSFNTAQFGESEFAGTIKYEDTNYSFNKAEIKLSPKDVETNGLVDGIIAPNSNKTYYVTYRVNAIDALTNDRLSLGNKVNIAEVNEFSTAYTTEYAEVLGYEKDTDGNMPVVSATAFDKYSAPGNYNIQEYANVFEFDMDYARVYLDDEPIDNPRTLSGIAWLDNENTDNNFNGQILGDGIYKQEDDYVIENINTQLVEVIDLPVIDENRNITEMYDEYEFYWDNSATLTNAEGKYDLNTMKMGDRTYKGLIPGNFIVRFIYGDNDAIIRDKDGNEITYSGIYDQDGELVKDENGEIIKPEVTKINGVDYKTTAYKAIENNFKDDYINNEWHDIFAKNEEVDNEEKDNEARDSEARRLEIIQKTQTLDNSNTSIFNVTNYANELEYAFVKIMENNPNLITDEVMKFIEISANSGENASEDELENYDNFVSENYDELYEYMTEYEDAKKDLYTEFYFDKVNGNGDFAYTTVKDKDGYSMFADTAKMNLKVEDPSKENLTTSTGYEILGINLGLEERSKTEFYLDKQIKEITLIKDEKTFFHVEYDIEYSNEDKFGFEQVDDKLWVKLTPVKETLVGEENLQSLNDKWTAESISQGFRYINIDSTLLQGLNLEIKYEISAINLSETDTYGSELDKIEDFDEVINGLYSPEYTLEYANSDDGRLYRRNTKKYKTYGEYLGHTYYQGFKESDDWGDNIVTTKVREIVDYIDNDIKVDTAEVGQNWDIYTDTTKLEGKVDKHIYRNVGKTDELAIMDEYENPYSTILVSTDSSEANEGFVKELKPIVKNGTIDDDSKATISLTTSKVFAGTDEGRTGMDNFIEILTLENTVGRRDVRTVCGNYNPHYGATQTTERDESSTELVTLSPPTGNIENDRQFITYIAILLTIAALAGAGVGIKLKISGKSKKSDKTE